MDYLASRRVPRKKMLTSEKCFAKSHLWHRLFLVPCCERMRERETWISFWFGGDCRYEVARPAISMQVSMG